MSIEQKSNSRESILPQPSTTHAAYIGVGIGATIGAGLIYYGLFPVEYVIWGGIINAFVGVVMRLDA